MEEEKRIDETMTPRQKCAIRHPVTDQSIPHERHFKTKQFVQSILTFELMSVTSLPGADDEVMQKCVMLNDGGLYFGVWHGRVSMRPPSLVSSWGCGETKEASGILSRLSHGVGISEGSEVHEGSDGKSVHTHVWATPAEIRFAESQLTSHNLILSRMGP